MQWLIDIVLENFKGMILMWSGAVVDIPSGWHLCDGTVGTPDLRNKFIPCAGDEYAPGDNDANPTHTHDFTGSGHHHTLTPFKPGDGVAIGTDFSTDTTTDPAVGTTDAVLARPPYYALCYIMKL